MVFSNVAIRCAIIAHIIIIIKSEVSNFPIVIIFSLVVCLRCLLHVILALIAYKFRANPEFVFIIIVLFMMSANIRIRFALQIVFICLYITTSHRCGNLSEDIKLINACQIYFVECIILRIFSQLFITQYVGLCDFSLPISCVMIERIYELCLIIIKSEVWAITHCLGLGHETIVCSVCLSIFL